MALMFQRLARNFIKQGYFPTDAETIARVLGALDGAERGRLRLLDPCCGEGVALAEVHHHLSQGGDRSDPVESYGIEYDKERAWHAKEILTKALHSDAQDCMVGKGGFGLLWLNPPYGDVVSDKTMSKADRGPRRLEKIFFQRFVGALAPGGVLVLIIPGYTVDAEFADWISRQFKEVRIYAAPEQRFKQAVLLGIKRGPRESLKGASEAAAALRQAVEQGLEEIPAHWQERPYRVPPSQSADLTFFSVKLDPDQLEQEIQSRPSLWDGFERQFNGGQNPVRSPLRQPSPWHLALALAAGAVSGLVTGRDGRRFVVRGMTYKEKRWREEFEEQPNGAITERRIATDCFVSVIRALDVTPDSPTFGQVITVK